jgi:phosphoglycerate dehydrogenase-like enzyme
MVQSLLERAANRLRSLTRDLIQQPKKYKTKNIGKKVALVGLGNQGFKLANQILEMGYSLKGICDLDSQKLQAGRRLSENIFVTTSIKELLARSSDIVVIATQAESHLQLISLAIKMGVRKILYRICGFPHSHLT